MQNIFKNCKLMYYIGIFFLALGTGIFMSAYFLAKPWPPANLKIVFLADRPELVPTLGGWTYNKWKNYDPTLTLERTIQSYQERLNRDKVPFVLLLLVQNKPVGMVSLNEHEPIAEFKDKTPWIGDFYILPEYDDKEVKMRQYLMRSLNGVAQNLGLTKLYVFTSDPSRVDWYVRLGWKIVKSSTYQNHMVTIMDFDVTKDS